MKLLSAVSALFLLQGAMSQECPEKLTQSQTLKDDDDGTVKMYYDIAFAPTADGKDVLCARLVSYSEGWIALGISPTGMMSDAEAIIGSPDDGTVQKYDLKSYGVDLMPGEKQTLMSNEITQTDGRTEMTFSKYLIEDEEHEILSAGNNAFLFAFGTDNTVGYHTFVNKGAFNLDFNAERPVASTAATEAPQSGDDSVSEPLIRTPAPTGATVPRDSIPPPTAPPVSAPTEAEPEPTDKAPTPAEPAPTPPTEPSGAMDRSKVGKMVLTAGAVAVWFGM